MSFSAWFNPAYKHSRLRKGKGPSFPYLDVIQGRWSPMGRNSGKHKASCLPGEVWRPGCFWAAQGRRQHPEARDVRNSDKFSVFLPPETGSQIRTKRSHFVYIFIFLAYSLPKRQVVPRGWSPSARPCDLNFSCV